MKRNDKSRNLKAVKNQIQQIEIYNEKLQVRHISLFPCCSMVYMHIYLASFFVHSLLISFSLQPGIEEENAGFHSESDIQHREASERQ
jgi:hypothetical protein